MAANHAETLEGIAKLDDHWLLTRAPEKDDDGEVPAATLETGIKPTDEAVKAARAFIEEGAFYPTPEGGVQWEADADAWTLTVKFNPDGTATILYS